jgi:hypothetical protein
VVRLARTVGVPGFEPHQPVPRRTHESSVVRVTCMLATDVCWDVKVYAHRLSARGLAGSPAARSSLPGSRTGTEARAGVFERPRNENGGRAKTLTPTPSTMGLEFDRHHLPRWRPEPPFLPGRTAEPEAPGARSGLPVLQQSQAGAEQREVHGTAGGSRGWAAQPSAARAPAPARGLQAASRRLPRPPTDPHHRRIGTATARYMARSFELHPRRGLHPRDRRTL